MKIPKKRYWLLTTEYPPFYGGGIGTYCKFWAEILSENGVHVTVFLADANIASITINEKYNIREIRFSPFAFKGLPPLGYNTLVSYVFAKIVGEYLEKEGVPDVLEAQEYNAIAYYVLQYKHLNYPLFKDLYVQIVCHAPSFLYLPVNKVPVYQLPYFWIGEMERFCLRAADQLISPSSFIIEEIKKTVCLDDKKIIIIPNPYKLDCEVASVPFNKNEALFYGKLSPSKGIFELLNFFSIIWAQGIALQLVLVGDENYFYYPENATCGQIIRKKYRKEILEKKLLLKTSMPFGKLKELISTTGIVIVPSLIDNFPYTVVESMALGKIVLTSTQGGQSELIQSGSNGFLFDHHKPDTFITQIKKILSLDQYTYNNITAAAKSTICEDCNPYNYLQKRLALFENVTRANSSVFPFIRTNSKRGLPQINSSFFKKEWLSVIVPYHNMGKYIHETINSIYTANYKTIEIILIDDGSTDLYSIQQLNVIKKKWPSVKVVSTSNNGLAAARNIGAENATGEFIAFLDADDIVHPSYYSRSIEVLKTKVNVHFTGCWTQYFGDSKDMWPTFTPEPPFLLVHNMINSSALVYKRQSFIDYGLNDPQMVFGMEDYESVISMVKHGCGGVVFPEILFYYRVRKNSMSRKFNKNKILYLYQKITQKHCEYYADFACEITNILLANGAGYKYDNPSLDHHQFSTLPFKSRVVKKVLVKVKRYPFIKQMAIKIYNYIKK